jgi:hypothetical protein
MSTIDRVNALRQRHLELDRQLIALSASTSSDNIAKDAVKRQKLAIKDEIATLEEAVN